MLTHFPEGFLKVYSFGVDENLNEFGAYAGDVNRRIIETATRMSPVDILQDASKSAARQIRNLAGAAKSSRYGGPLLVFLAVAGFLLGPWNRRRLSMQAFLVLMLAGVTVSLFTIQYFQFRYSYILLPFLLLWGAHAIEKISVWVRRRLIASRRPLAASFVSRGIGIGIVAVVLLVAAKVNLGPEYDEVGSTRAGAMLTREAGLWLREQYPREKVIMDAASAIPYYARAEYIGLPYSTSQTALRYIDSKSPDYVVIRSVLGNHRPYLDEWRRNGIPGNSHRLVYDAGGPGEDRIQIYRWRQSGGTQ